MNQDVLRMMPKCIIFKVGEAQKTKNNKNRGEFINFVEIAMKYAICIIGLRGMVVPAQNYKEIA